MAKSMEELFDDLDNESRSDSDFDYTKIVKAAFGWAGGKSKCLDKILPHLPYYNGFVEPFGGSASILLARQESKLEVYNDRFGGVVDFYRCLRDKNLCDQLTERLNFFVHSREEWQFSKDNWEKQNDPVGRAALWYYLITYSFAKRGDAFGRSTYNVNVTSGLHFRKSLTFEKIHTRIRNVLFENLDFRDIFKDFSHPETVFYLDPPYLQTSHTAYFGNYFSKKDHVDLLECIFKSSSFCAVSNHDNDLYNSYKWDKKITWDQYRSVKCPDLEDDSEFRERDTEHKMECLWIKERS